MQENPISAIENAELTAKQIVQKANEDKSSLILNAQKEAAQDLAGAVEKALTESRSIIQSAQQSILTDSAHLDNALEEDKANIIRKAEDCEDTAVGAILEIISEKKS